MAPIKWKVTSSREEADNLKADIEVKAEEAEEVIMKTLTKITINVEELKVEVENPQAKDISAPWAANQSHREVIHLVEEPLKVVAERSTPMLTKVVSEETWMGP